MHMQVYIYSEYYTDYIILLYIYKHLEPDVAPKACAEEIGYTYLVRLMYSLCLCMSTSCVCVFISTNTHCLYSLRRNSRVFCPTYTAPLNSSAYPYQ